MLKRTFLSLITAATIAIAVPTAFAQETSPMLMPTTSGYADVNGISLHYQTYGAGDPLVLLHGGFGVPEMFMPILPALAASHTVIGVDLQGHGRNMAVDRPMTLEAMADDVAALITHLGYDKADVMGYSTGGMVGLQIGINHPEVVDRLVLVSTAFARRGWHDYNLAGMSQISAASAEMMKQSPMYEAFSSMNPEPEANWPVLNEQMGRMVNTDYDYSEGVKTVQAPTMLIIGDHDSVRPSHIVEFFNLLGGGLADAEWDKSKMVRHRLAILPGLTHYDIFMSPVLAETALGFLDAGE